MINVSLNPHPKGFFLTDYEQSRLLKKNQFDYERAHTHSSCYLATNKALLVIAVPQLAAKKKKKEKWTKAVLQSHRFLKETNKQKYVVLVNLMIYKTVMLCRLAIKMHHFTACYFSHVMA